MSTATGSAHRYGADAAPSVSAPWRRLMRDALSEVLLREPRYFERFGLSFGPLDVELERFSRQPLFQALPRAELRGALAEARDFFASQEEVARGPDAAPDAVGEMLLDSAMDGYLALHGLLSLRSRPAPQEISALLVKDYDERRTAQGTRYFVRRRGTRALVVINAVGIPLAAWSCFLGDDTHPFRIILVEGGCADLLCGGMPRYADTLDDAAGIAAVLAAEGEGSVDVVGWCSGSRAAIEIARRCPEVIRKLVLVAPALPGDTQWGGTANVASFESSVFQVFTAIERSPQLATAFMKALRVQSGAPDWNGLSASAKVRVETLFSLPPLEHAGSLLLPLSNLDFFRNYGRRGQADAAYSLEKAFVGIRAPTLLVTGDNDRVIDNARMESMLQSAGARLARARLKAAGHHIQDLQYPYFRMLLESFLIDDRLPPSAARLQVLS